MFQSSQSISFISFISFLNEIKFPFCTFFSTFPLASFIHRTKSPHYLARNKKKKKKPSFFFPIFITHSFTGVQQLLSTRVQAMKGIKGSDTRIGITFLPAPLFRFDHSVDAQSEIYRVPLSFETPPSPPRQPRGTTSRGAPSDPYAIQLPVCPVLSRGAVKTIRASRRLFANKPRARAFISPPGGNPSSPPPLSRSKLSIESFQGYLCELARKKIGPLSTMVFDDTTRPRIDGW